MHLSTSLVFCAATALLAAAQSSGGDRESDGQWPNPFFFLCPIAHALCPCNTSGPAHTPLARTSELFERISNGIGNDVRLWNGSLQSRTPEMFERISKGIGNNNFWNGTLPYQH
ncbi:Protein of unknown function [Gryllus bimaculatus]|nr:Protein of unknown function [Gryllus bimaculatus]